jgi:hypothetical protein
MTIVYRYWPGRQALLALFDVVRNATGAAEPLSVWSIIQVWARMASPRKVIVLTSRNGYQSENIRKPGKTVRILVRSFFFVISLVFNGPWVVRLQYITTVGYSVILCLYRRIFCGLLVLQNRCGLSLVVSLYYTLGIDYYSYWIITGFLESSVDWS